MAMTTDIMNDGKVRTLAATMGTTGDEEDDERSMRTRLCILEAALACIAREAEVALGRPDIAFLTMCRVSSIARQAGALEPKRRGPGIR